MARDPVERLREICLALPETTAKTAHGEPTRRVGGNYFVCSFQWGDLSHEHAMRSIELFATEVMPRYVTASPRRVPSVGLV